MDSDDDSFIEVSSRLELELKNGTSSLKTNNSTLSVGFRFRARWGRSPLCVLLDLSRH